MVLFTRVSPGGIEVEEIDRYTLTMLDDAVMDYIHSTWTSL